MNHRDLAKLSMKDLEYEVGESKQCLREHGFPNATILATPMNSGWDNVTVVNMTSKYYDTARSGNGEPMFLNCDKWNEDQKDCMTYYDNGTLTFANRYTSKAGATIFMTKSMLTIQTRFWKNSQVLWTDKHNLIQTDHWKLYQF